MKTILASALLVLLVATHVEAAVITGTGGGASVGLDDAFGIDPTISPTSEAAPLKIRGTGAMSTTGWNIYTHSNGTPTIKCVVSDVEGDCHVSVDLSAGKSFIIKDAGAAVLTITPDNAGNLKYVWAAGYRPIKTLSLPADALYPRGSSTLVTGTALITSGLISPYITTTDSDNDGFYRYLVMDPKWDGGTVTATVTVLSVNATPANNFEVDISGECYPAGTAVTTTISATGEQAALIDFDASGACGGSACSQFDPASATTAAITINGTPAGGNFCAFQGQVDATATTATATDIKIVQLDIHYGISQGF